jgi:uncharacterized protein YqeY
MLSNNPQSIINLLRSDLLIARKKRDSLTADTLRSVIAAVDNAGAVPVSMGIHAIGTGSTEMPRRELSEQDLIKIVESEIAEMQQAVKEFGDANSTYTDELNKKIALLENYLGIAPPN